MIGCLGLGKKYAPVGIFASFALVLDVSIPTAVSSNTFTDIHMRFARSETK